MVTVRLEVTDGAGEVLSAHNLTVEPGATVSISGFHGSRVYEISEHDTALAVRFTGVTSVKDAPKEVKVEQQETEDGVKETEAEAMQRQAAEELAAENDAAAKKDKPSPLVTKK